MSILSLRQDPHVRQFVKFGLVGIMTTALNFAIYASLLALHVHYLLAAVVAFLIATLNSYTFNRTWTFRAGAHQNSRLAKFVTVQSIGLAINLMILSLLIEHFSLNKLLAQLVASVAVVGVGFLGNKFWSFR